MAGKQLEKVLKIKCCHGDSKHLFSKNVGDYPRNITTSVRQLGAIAQRLGWCQYCIGNDN